MDAGEDVSDYAMELMHAISTGRGLPVSISQRDLARLSEGECLILDRAARKCGRRAEFEPDGGRLTIRD